MSKTKGLERRRLAVLVLSAFLVRLAVQLREQSRPGFVWLDPDGYMRIGRTLAEGEARKPPAYPRRNPRNAAITRRVPAPPASGLPGCARP